MSAVQTTSESRSFDVDAAMEMIKNGGTFAKVAKEFGVNRNMIAKEAAERGIASRKSYSVRRQFHEEIVDKALKERMLPREAAEHFNVNVQVVYMAFRDKDINPAEHTKAVNTERLMPYVERVKQGESVRSIAGGDEGLGVKIYRLCSRLGIKLDARSKKPKEEAMEHENA